MNRRRFLSLVPLMTTICASRDLLAASYLEAGHFNSSTRHHFVEARSEADFWIELTQPVKAIPYLRTAYRYGKQCATREERCEVLNDLRTCRYDLGRLKQTVWSMRNQLAREASRPKVWLGLVQHLLCSGNYKEAALTSNKALQVLDTLQSVQRADFLAMTAFSSYCLDQHEKALQQIENALGVRPDPREIHHLLLQDKILILCALRRVQEANGVVGKYVRLYGALPKPQRYRLNPLGIDV